MSNYSASLGDRKDAIHERLKASEEFLERFQVVDEFPESAPIFLRVVKDCHTREIDALDLVTDTPRTTEVLHAYRLQGEVSRVHLYRPKAGNSGWYVVATYALVKEQPSQREMRHSLKWQKWCEKEDKQSRRKV